MERHHGRKRGALLCILLAVGMLPLSTPALAEEDLLWAPVWGPNQVDCHPGTDSCRFLGMPKFLPPPIGFCTRPGEDCPYIDVGAYAATYAASRVPARELEVILSLEQRLCVFNACWWDTVFSTNWRRERDRTHVEVESGWISIWKCDRTYKFNSGHRVNGQNPWGNNTHGTEFSVPCAAPVTDPTQIQPPCILREHC